MKIGNVLVVYTMPTTKEYESTLHIVKITLRKFRIKYSMSDRDRLTKKLFQDADLVLVVGGDGTFLRAAQFIENQLIFGVNADVKNKEGFFMKSDKNNFEVKLKKIIALKFIIKKLPRLAAFVNGKRIDALALNEFFIGPRKSYHAAKYVLQANGRRERQKSSGILITTPTGSYAWAKSCYRKTLPLRSRNFQFVVREPYEGKVFKNYRLKHGIIKSKNQISIASEMLDGVLVADSVGKEYNFKNGSKAAIRLSKNYLNTIWPR